MQRSLLFAALFAASPVGAELSTVTEAGFVSNHAATVAAEPAAVWKVLIAPNQWWSPSHTYSGDATNLYLDAQASGCFCEKLPRPADAPVGQRMGSVEHMHVVYADPQHGVLRMIGGLGPLQGEAVPAVLTITIKREGQGSRIDWRYAVGGPWPVKPAELAPLVDKVLAEQVSRLADEVGRQAMDAPPAK